jgi:hypothetical protein
MLESNHHFREQVGVGFDTVTMTHVPIFLGTQVNIQLERYTTELNSVRFTSILCLLLQCVAEEPVAVCLCFSVGCTISMPLHRPTSSCTCENAEKIIP